MDSFGAKIRTCAQSIDLVHKQGLSIACLGADLRQDNRLAAIDALETTLPAGK
jgi:hypothetical protein